MNGYVVANEHIPNIFETLHRKTSYFFCGSFVSCVSHAFAFVHCCLVVTCWKRTDLLALDVDVYCIFVTFPCGILGQVWYLIVSFPNLCRLSYLDRYVFIRFCFKTAIKGSVKYNRLYSLKYLH